MLNWILPITGGIALVTGLALSLYSRHRVRRALARLNAMLNAAIDGNFQETVFNESLFSATEAKLSNFLSASNRSVAATAKERDNIAQLISDISHQTKTPISNISLYSQLLQEQPLPPQSRECVDALAAQSQKLQFLIDSLMKASRLESGIVTIKPERSALAPLLQDLVQSIAPKAQQKNIAVTLSPTEVQGYFDPKWTAEALYNILDNAVKYTPEGGTVAITVTPYNLFCRIDLQDSGIGIEPEEHAEVFKRFYRSPAVAYADGVGLGLYLARHIITEQGGYIKLTSALGAGSIFSVFLPQEP